MGTNSSSSGEKQQTEPTQPPKKKKIKSEPCRLLQLPRTHLQLIFSNLSVFELAVAQGVCKGLNDEVNQSSEWTRKGRFHFPELRGNFDTDEEWKGILYEYFSKKKRFTLDKFRFHVSLSHGSVMRHHGVAYVEEYRPEINPKYKMKFEHEIPEYEWNLVHNNYDTSDEVHALITIIYHKNTGKMVRKFRMKKNNAHSFTTTMGERKVLVQVHHKSFQFLMKPKNMPSQFKLCSHDTVVTNLLKVFGVQNVDH